jgi:hypothetical protein
MLIVPACIGVDMPIRDFPFIKPTTRFRCAKPFLAVRITNITNGKSFRTYGLIDTGADRTSFPKFIADNLGCILPKKGRKVETAGGPGEVFPYEHCRIEILDTRSGGGSLDLKKADDVETVYTFEEITVDFSKTLRISLIGVENMLDQFMLEVNYPQKTFSMLLPETG